MRSFWVRKRAPQGRKQGLDPHKAAGSPVLTSSTQETGLPERDCRDLGTARAGRNQVPKLGQFKQRGCTSMEVNAFRLEPTRFSQIPRKCAPLGGPSPLASFSSKATHHRERVHREQKSQGLLRIPRCRQVIRPVISSQRMVIKATFHHSDGGNSHPRGEQ